MLALGGGACRRPASCAPSASRSSAGRGRTAAAAARETDRPVARGHVRGSCRAVCWPACCRVSSSTRWPRSCTSMIGGRMPAQGSIAGCRSCRSPRAAAPTTACWSSPSSPFDAPGGPGHPPLRLAALRRGPAWDCGFPDPSPATQYTADSFAQPFRRVFGDVYPRTRDGRHAGAGRSASGAPSRRAARSGLGRVLRADQRRDRVTPPRR